MAVSTTTHKANYYDDYIGSMEIFQLDGNNAKLHMVLKQQKFIQRQ